MNWCPALLATAVLLSAGPALGAPTRLTLLHVNDTHSRLDAYGPKDLRLDGTEGGLMRVRYRSPWNACRTPRRGCATSTYRELRGRAAAARRRAPVPHRELVHGVTTGPCDNAPVLGAIRHVSDTAHWVAMYRALESERPDALFRDPHARRLAGPRGEAILRTMPGAHAGAWTLIVRTAIFDELVLRLVGRGVRTVVNLASGLDARPFRMALPPDLRWIDVDLPAVQDYKRAALEHDAPRCRLEWIAADLADAHRRREVLEQVASGPGPALALTEGLLIYLDAAAVAAFGADLRGCAPLAWWIADLVSPMQLRLLGAGWGRSVADGNAPFRFAPADAPRFFANAGWREVEYRSIWEESVRLRRTFPLGALLGALWRRSDRLYPRALREGIRRLAGVSLLGRLELPPDADAGAPSLGGGGADGGA